MGNVLLYTLLMAGIAFAIGFFVAFIIKIVFNTIQKMMRARTADFKTGMHRVRHINRIRRHNNLLSINSVGAQLRNGRFSTSNDARLNTNEIVEYYYGKS